MTKKQMEYLHASINTIVNLIMVLDARVSGEELPDLMKRCIEEETGETDRLFEEIMDEYD